MRCAICQGPGDNEAVRSTMGRSSTGKAWTTVTEEPLVDRSKALVRIQKQEEV
jgi:hypothetical protein